jgi:hypothetical protein
MTMPDDLPVCCLECGGDQWYLRRAPRGGLSAACIKGDSAIVVHGDLAEEGLLSHTEVTGTFGVDRGTISRWRGAGKLTPVPTVGGVVRYRAADVKALMAGGCPRGYECARYPDFADLLGHDRQGHTTLRALVTAGITTRDQLTTAELRNVRGLGTTRIVLIRYRLGKAEADDSVNRR